MKILPAINAKNFDDAKKQIEILSSVTNEFHFDVAFSDFAEVDVWGNAREIDLFSEDILLHVHLMAHATPQDMLQWQNPRVASLAVHLEGSTLPDGLLRMAKKTKRKVFIVYPPRIDFSFLKKYIPHSDGVMVLGVMPGKSGQQMLPDTISRIHAVRELLQEGQELVVDGGVNKANFQEIKGCNPDTIVLGSAIFGTDDPIAAYREFEELVKN